MKNPFKSILAKKPNGAISPLAAKIALAIRSGDAVFNKSPEAAPIFLEYEFPAIAGGIKAIGYCGSGAPAKWSVYIHDEGEEITTADQSLINAAHCDTNPHAEPNRQAVRDAILAYEPKKGAA